MQFQTRIVVGNKNPNARIAWGGAGLLFVSMVLMCVSGYQRYGFWLMGLAVIVLVIGLVAGRGDVDVIKVSETELVVDPEAIRVGDQIFRLSELSRIEFQVEGYDGMADAEGYSSSTGRSYQRRLNGVNNYLNFRVGEEKQEWQFYLQDPEHVQMLGALFKQWYSKGIVFRERNVTNDRTFLFAPVSKRQWEDLMVEHGYDIAGYEA
jgi:hypothetical protein